MAQKSNIVAPTAVSGGVTAPAGFLAHGLAAGLKSDGSPDVALVASAAGTVPAAAVFTTNTVAAAPVIVSRRHMAEGRARAVIINAGNANACTGARGLVDAESTAARAADLLDAQPSQIIVGSTGVIGIPLPIALVLDAVPAAVAGLSADGGAAAARAIMTTDRIAKEAAASVVIDGRTYTVGGMAKGSGMIAPNMATMLSVITTDAPLTSQACDTALRSAVNTTFNRVTVDTDMSTNDMVVLMASGAAGGSPIAPGSSAYTSVALAVHAVCEALARLIARDGEGATKLVTVNVGGAADESDAAAAAFAVAGSPLVKAAIFGRDANWGRVAMAIGKSGCELDPTAFDIRFAGIDVCRGGSAVGFDEDAALEALGGTDVTIDVDLNIGTGSATVWTCDLTCDYVRINGEYRS
jgi:glutamate N-acetyltransferase/amino-acid N-acetyltransferase